MSVIKDFQKYISENHNVQITTKFIGDYEEVTCYTSKTPKGRVITFCTNDVDVVRFLTQEFNKDAAIYDLYLYESQTKIEDVVADFNDWYYNWFTMHKEYYKSVGLLANVK